MNLNNKSEIISNENFVNVVNPGVIISEENINNITKFDNFENDKNSLYLKENETAIKTNFTKIKSRSKLTTKKRSRRSASNITKSNNSNILNKESASKSNQNIISLMNKFQNEPSFHFLTTPKKTQNLRKNYNLNTSSGSGLNSLNSLSTVKNSLHKHTRSSNKLYRDTTLSHLMATATTSAVASTARRTSQRLNIKDLDNSVVKKLNMNVSNEPLFGGKNSSTGINKNK